MLKYDKLVRDKIINIIEKDSRKAEFEKVEGEVYKQYLIKKLQEEVDEYKEELSMEEIVDILEVIEALLSLQGLDWDKIFQIKKEKAEARGKFNKGIVLKSVTQN